MVFKQLSIQNFGVYGSLHVLDLAPNASGHFNRPITLFWGKNGVGKTTLVEAIKVCLHGTLALGGRVSRRQYEDYITNKFHKIYADRSVDKPATRHLELTFDFVSAGKVLAYRVRRQWQLVKGRLTEQTQIWVDGQVPATLADDQYDGFLRDLISPSATNLFFFDGEKIESFTREEGGVLLGETIKSLLGIHLVEQLQRDLDVFISRQSAVELNEAPDIEKADMLEKLGEYHQQLTELEGRQRQLMEQLQGLMMAIDRQEQRILSEGGGYIGRQEKLLHEHSLLEKEVGLLRRKVQDLCGGLLPFAIGSRYGKKVQQRLLLEHEYSQWKTAQKLLDRQLTHFNQVISHPTFWDMLDPNTSKVQVEQLVRKVQQQAQDSFTTKEIDPQQVIHQLSEQEHLKLSTWIDQSLLDVPETFSTSIGELTRLEEQLKKAVDALTLTAQADFIIQPLLETKQQLAAEKQMLTTELTTLAREIGLVEYKVTQAQSVLKNREVAAAQHRKEQHQVSLAVRSKAALMTYQHRLTIEKIRLLEAQLVARFNELCRKESMINRAEIDSSTFSVSLFRQESLFGRDQLSAGERQLLAIAIIWALRDVSGLPIPVIIDTPLGRLDSDHRQSMVHQYFPRASHQVILLATDTEIDRTLLTELEPMVSQAYHLAYDPVTAETQIEHLPFAMAAPATEPLLTS